MGQGSSTKSFSLRSAFRKNFLPLDLLTRFLAWNQLGSGSRPIGSLETLRDDTIRNANGRKGENK
ncbi:hypothetical protein AMS60_01915 [Bacillus sp. FJAT-21945]|nr:hypothetical protein AMS60_01915 [Bacillus sp. FJAT-21945]